MDFFRILFLYIPIYGVLGSLFSFFKVSRNQADRLDVYQLSCCLPVSLLALLVVSKAAEPAGPWAGIGVILLTLVALPLTGSFQLIWTVHQLRTLYTRRKG